MKTLKGTCNDWKAECFAATLALYLTCLPTSMPSVFATLGHTPHFSLPLMNFVNSSTKKHTTSYRNKVFKLSGFQNLNNTVQLY